MEKKFKLFKIQTVSRQSTDGQSLRQYSVSTRLFRLAALFTLLFTIGVGQMWGTRLFQTGQKVYFQDATLTSTMSGKRWKSDTNGNVYAYFFNQKDHVGNNDVTNWAEGAGKLVYGTDGAANAIYEFTVPSLPSGGDGVWWGVIFTRGTAASWDNSQTWNQTTDQYPEAEKSLFTIKDEKSSSNWNGTWSVMPEMLCSSITDPEWSKEDGLFFTDYSGEKGIVKINCTASQSFQFIVFDGTNYKSYDNNSHTTWDNYGPQTDGGGYNFQFTAGEAGEYVFQWDKTNHKLWVWEPKARLTKQKYIYFDARNLTGSNSDYWQRGSFTARFWFKYYDSGSDKGSVDCTKANALEDWVYYALVPDDEYLGQIQMNRLPVSSESMCAANVAYAKNRTNVTQNCLTGSTDWCSSWDPSWTTYCPPTTSETFADNSTTKISWQPNTNDGTTSAKAIWVKTGTTIKVAATASKAVADDNMTIKYDFKVDGSSQQNTTTATYTHSASTNNTTYELNADIYTNYNLDNTKNSTKHTQSSIFYKALDTYSVTHALSGVTKASGREGDDAAAYYVAYDATYTANAGYYLPSDITVTIGGVTKTKGTDYTWTVTDGTSGALSILANKISGNVVVTINGVWRWSVAGSWKVITPGEGDPYWDPDTYAMGNITQVSGDVVCSINISLPANLDYEFKVIDRNGYVWNGTPNGDQVSLTYTSGNGDATALTSDDGNMNILLNTAGAGTYTFTYNITDHTLTVTYPTSYTVTYDDNGSTGGTVPTDNDYYAANATVTVKGNGGSLTKTGYNTLAYWNTENDGRGTDIAISTGTFSITDNTTLYAKWTPAILTYVGGTGSNWNTTANWSPACLPTIEHDVVLNVPVEVNVEHATAKSIVIYNDGDTKTGKLTIQPNKGLEVAGTIRKTTDGSSYSATGEADLVLESNEDGNATLIFDNSNSDQATVQMYSKGWTTGTQGSGTWNWQMIGTPVTDATRINDYYDGYMYKWSSGWVDMTDFSETLTPFAAYSATYPTTSDKLHTYSIDGTLVPTGDKTIGVAASSVQAAANSWTAPIRIKDITYTDWSPATIFLYNTGYNPEDGDAPEKAGSRYAAGTYLPVPVSSALYLDESYIAPMQGFFFKSASSGTITLSYADAVRTDGSGEIIAGEMHAPKRAMAAEPAVLKMYVSDSQHDDRLVLLEREDFSRGFDNGWDGEKFQINAVKTAPRIFAINETGGKESVSAIPELENTVIGFRPGTEETYTIHFDYNGDETLYLRDTRTGAETLITNESEYIFLSDGTNEDARFIISRIQSTPTGVEETGAGSKAYKLMIEDHIYIIRDGRMYSIDGALVNLERK